MCDQTRNKSSRLQRLPKEQQNNIKITVRKEAQNLLTKKSQQDCTYCEE